MYISLLGNLLNVDLFSTFLFVFFPEVKLFHRSVIHEGWLSLIGITFSLGIIGVALLVHLFGFHCYLSKYSESSCNTLIIDK